MVGLPSITKNEFPYYSKDRVLTYFICNANNNQVASLVFLSVFKGKINQDIILLSKNYARSIEVGIKMIG